LIICKLMSIKHSKNESFFLLIKLEIFIPNLIKELKK
jgi:hypothetical protein